MFKAVPCRPHTTEVRFRSQANPSEVFLWTKWHWNRIISDQFDFTLSVPLHHYSVSATTPLLCQCHSTITPYYIIFIIILLLSNGQAGKHGEPTLNQSNAVQDIGDQLAGRQELLHCCLVFRWFSNHVKYIHKH